MENLHNSVIKTDRLLLRPLTQSDAEAAFKWVGDERVTRYMIYVTYKSIEQVKRWLASVENDLDSDSYIFGYERKSDGMLIGCGSVDKTSELRDGEPVWSIGYNLRYDCWGIGYATEAARAMIRFAVENFGAKHFASAHAEQNKASGRVMEKCGMKFVGYGTFQKIDGSETFRSMKYEMDVILQ